MNRHSNLIRHISNSRSKNQSIPTKYFHYITFFRKKWNTYLQYKVARKLLSTTLDKFISNLTNELYGFDFVQPLLINHLKFSIKKWIQANKGDMRKIYVTRQFCEAGGPQSHFSKEQKILFRCGLGERGYRISGLDFETRKHVTNRW